MDWQGQTSVAIHDEYRRRARRIRAIHAGNPALLHRALRELAAVQTRQVVAKPPDSNAQSFADLVADSMDGPILRYSSRRALLRAADAAGIGRFEANLIIAAVQHQSDREASGTPIAPTRPLARNALVWAAFLLLQTSIFIAVWRLLST